MAEKGNLCVIWIPICSLARPVLILHQCNKSCPDLLAPLRCNPEINSDGYWSSKHGIFTFIFLCCLSLPHQSQAPSHAPVSARYRTLSRPISCHKRFTNQLNNQYSLWLQDVSIRLKIKFWVISNHKTEVGFAAEAYMITSKLFKSDEITDTFRKRVQRIYGWIHVINLSAFDWGFKWF